MSSTSDKKLSITWQSGNTQEYDIVSNTLSYQNRSLNDNLQPGDTSIKMTIMVDADFILKMITYQQDNVTAVVNWSGSDFDGISGILDINTSIKMDDVYKQCDVSIISLTQLLDQSFYLNWEDPTTHVIAPYQFTTSMTFDDQVTALLKYKDKDGTIKTIPHTAFPISGNINTKQQYDTNRKMLNDLCQSVGVSYYWDKNQIKWIDLSYTPTAIRYSDLTRYPNITVRNTGYANVSYYANGSKNITQGTAIDVAGHNDQIYTDTWSGGEYTETLTIPDNTEFFMYCNVMAMPSTFVMNKNFGLNNFYLGSKNSLISQLKTSMSGSNITIPESSGDSYTMGITDVAYSLSGNDINAYSSYNYGEAYINFCSLYPNLQGNVSNFYSTDTDINHNTLDTGKLLEVNPTADTKFTITGSDGKEQWNVKDIQSDSSLVIYFAGQASFNVYWWGNNPTGSGGKHGPVNPYLSYSHSIAAGTTMPDSSGKWVLSLSDIPFENRTFVYDSQGDTFTWALVLSDIQVTIDYQSDGTTSFNPKNVLDVSVTAKIDDGDTLNCAWQVDIMAGFSHFTQQAPNQTYSTVIGENGDKQLQIPESADYNWYNSTETNYNQILAKYSKIQKISSNEISFTSEQNYDLGSFFTVVYADTTYLLFITYKEYDDKGDNHSIKYKAFIGLPDD